MESDFQGFRARQNRKRLCHEVIEGIVDPTRKFADSVHPVLIRRLRAEHITRINKGEERLKLVIPILPPPANMQREVDLGVGGFGERHDLQSLTI